MTSSKHQLQPPILSSKQRNWDNILVERFHQPPGSINLQNNKDHMICISLVPKPIQLLQVKGDQTHNGLHTQGDISLTPVGLPMMDVWDDDNHYLLISINSQHIQDTAVKVFDKDPNSVSLVSEFCVRDPHLESIGKMLLAELENGENKGTGEKLYIESLTELLSVHLVRNYTVRQQQIPIYTNGLSVKQLLQVTDFVEEHLEQKILLTDIAELLEISQFHFCRMFKKSMGISFYQYILQQRIERAKILLLKQTELQIAEIALDCGFSSQSHMSQCFRKLTGMTPKTYRLAQRQKIKKLSA